MSTTGERVKEVRLSLHLTLEKFGKCLGVGKTAINKIEKNENNLTDQMSKSICREWDVNEDWLRYGTGEMFLPHNRNEDIARLTKQLLLDEDDSFKNRLISMLSNLKTEEWELLERKMIEVVMDNKKD